jgi:hypothetical protein
MSDYIRRDDALKGQKTGTFANGICLEAKACVPVDYIESLEPADVAPVVRCKDCENWQTDWNPSIPDRHYYAVMDSMMKADDFCSYGERKE